MHQHQSFYNSTKEEEYLHLLKDLLKYISSFGVFMIVVESTV